MFELEIYENPNKVGEDCWYFRLLGEDGKTRFHNRNPDFRKISNITSPHYST